MELTRDKIEWLAKQPCITEYVKVETEELLCIAKQLLREMDKPGVWDNAPEWATKADITWSAKTHYSGVYKSYTRELPKTRIDEIAEEYKDMKYLNNQGVPCNVDDAIRSAILQARKEWEAER